MECAWGILKSFSLLYKISRKFLFFFLPHFFLIYCLLNICPNICTVPLKILKIKTKKIESEKFKGLFKKKIRSAIKK